MPGCALFVRAGSNRGDSVCTQARLVSPACSQCPSPPPHRGRQDLLHAEHLPHHLPAGPGALPPCPGLSERPSTVQVTSACAEPALCHSARAALCLAEAPALSAVGCRMILHGCLGLSFSPVLSASPGCQALVPLANTARLESAAQLIPSPLGTLSDPGLLGHCWGLLLSKDYFFCVLS